MIAQDWTKWENTRRLLVLFFTIGFRHYVAHFFLLIILLFASLNIKFTYIYSIPSTWKNCNDET